MKLYLFKKSLTMASRILLLCIAFFGCIAFAHGGATFSDCGGPDKSITIKEGSVKPDPIQYPGNLSVTVLLEVLKDLPASNFEMHLNLVKLDPRRMNVPCLQDIGSCTYDVCQMIENHKSEFCPMFPTPDKCGCPMKVGTYNMKNALVAIPDFGEIFVKILQGHYEGNMTFIDKATNKQVGCCAMTFEIVPSS